MVLATAVLIGIPLTTSGCFDLAELEDFAFASALGIDQSDHPGWVRVTALFPIPPQRTGGGMAGGGGGGGGGGSQLSNMIVTSEGPTILAATRQMGLLTDRRITYSSAQLVVIGEEFARAGLSSIVDALDRSEDFRSSLFVSVAGGTTAEELLTTVRPDLARDPAVYLSGLIETGSRDHAATAPARVHDLAIAYKTPGFEITLPILRMEQKPTPPVPPQEANSGGGGGGGGGGSQGGGGGQEGGGQGASGGQSAGDQASAPPPVERRATARGLALFKGDRMVAELTDDETLGYLLIRGRFTRCEVTANGPATQGADVVFTLTGGRAQTRVKLEGDMAMIDIEAEMEANISEIGAPVQIIDTEDLPQVADLLAADVRRRIEEAIDIAQTEVQGDIFNLGIRTRPMFLTWDQWQALDWNRAFTEAQVTVKVKVTELRSSLILQPVQPQ